MHLLLTGISHKRVPVATREKLSFTTHETEHSLGKLVEISGVREVMLLSTCNRTELLVHHAHEPQTLAAFEEELQGMLCSLKGIDPLDPELFDVQHDLQAVTHLFRVTGGLESLVPGESQIFGQVKNAYTVACRVGTSGYMLNRMVHRAFRAGKRARTETTIGEGSGSVSHAAAVLADTQLEKIGGKNVLVIGAGEMGRITAKSLKRRCDGELTVANRSFQKAQALAVRTDAKAVSLAELPDVLGKADVIVAATTAPQPMITKQMLEEIPCSRPKVIIDIGVPRNVAEDVAELDMVTLFSIDDLRDSVEQSLTRRREEAAKVEQIIGEEVAQFAKWFRSLAVEPTIKNLIDTFETVRKEELSRVEKHFTAEQIELLDAMSSRIVGKILHKPIQHLKNTHKHEQVDNSEYWIEIVSDIFDLEINSDE